MSSIGASTKRHPRQVSTDQAPDRLLVEAYLRDRSERAFRQLYRRHASSLYRFALLRVGADGAEDVVQETWIRAAQQLHRFQWQASLRSWLTGIALNCCREVWRKQQRSPPPADASQTLARGEGLRLDLARAVEELPERAREVLMLHDVQGFTHLEIGATLGIEAGTSKSQLSRARAALRALLDTSPLDQKGTPRHG